MIYGFIFLASFLLSILVMFTGSSFLDFFGFEFKFVFSALSFFGFTFLIYKVSDYYKKSRRLSLIVLTIPPTLILIFTLTEFTLTLGSLPSNLAYIFGVSFCVLYFRLKQIAWKIIITMLFSISLFYVYFSFYPQWLHYVGFGSFSGAVNKKEVSIQFQGINEKYKVVTDKEFNDKVVVFNFWNTGCGYCHKFFPKFKELSTIYGSKDTVFVAFNSPLKRDKLSKAINFFDISNSNVTVIIPNESSLLQALGVSGFPSYMVINKSSEVVFHGSVDMLEKYLKSN